MAAGLGEAASVAGIVSLALQSVEAIIAISDFCKAYKEADADVLRATNDLELLQQVLVHVEATACQALAPSKCPSSLVVFLHDCVARCRDDLTSWRPSIRALEPKSASGARKAWKKIKIAADGKRFISIAARAMTHAHRINTCLELIDCGLDLEIRATTRATNTAVTGLTDITNTFRAEASTNFHALSSAVSQNRDMTKAAFASIEADVGNLSVKAEANTAIAQLSQHVLHQLRTEQQDGFRQVKNQISDYCKFAAQQFSIVSAAQLDTNVQLSAIQVTQLLTQGILSQCLNSHSNLRRLRYRCTQANLGKCADFSGLIHSPRLKVWSSSQESALVMLQSPYLHRVLVQSFGIILIDSLTRASVPTIWAMASTRKENMEAETLAINALRSLVQQALFKNPKLHTEAALTKICARLSEAGNSTSLLSVLATALHGLPLIYLIIDIQFLHTLDPLQTWPLRLLAMLQEINDHNPDTQTIVKVMLVSYQSKTTWQPTNSIHRNMVIWAHGPKTIGSTRSSIKSLRGLVLRRNVRDCGVTRPRVSVSFKAQSTTNDLIEQVMHWRT